MPFEFVESPPMRKVVVDVREEIGKALLECPVGKAIKAEKSDAKDFRLAAKELGLWIKMTRPKEGAHEGSLLVSVRQNYRGNESDCSLQKCEEEDCSDERK